MTTEAAAPPHRTPSSSGIPAVAIPIPKDPAEAETQRRMRASVSAFDDLIAANLAMVAMGHRLMKVAYVVLGVVLLESGLTLYAMVHR